MAFHRITINLNGSAELVDVPSNMTLLQMLREKLALTGTKNGCAAGECGACTVLLNGERERLHGPGGRVRRGQGDTWKGVARQPQLDPVQQAVIAQEVQCGFCTPGADPPGRCSIAIPSRRMMTSRMLCWETVPLHWLSPAGKRRSTMQPGGNTP
jgi:hypothetical protein